MKRIRSKAALILAVLCVLSLVLSGCAVKGFERDLSMVAVNDDGTLVSVGTVNIFNNWILPDTAVSAENPDHYFLGWSVDPVYQGEESARLIYNAKSVVHYNEVEQYANGNNVTLYAIYGEQPRQTAELHYLVVGWYAKTATTGLDETIMEGFTSALMDYLRTQGATEAELADVVVKAYDGNVATIGEAINTDGNVDILIGVGNNIDSTGNVKVLEKHGGSFVGEISRYTARLTDSELVNDVYAWVMETYGATTDEPSEPTQPTTPTEPAAPAERTHYLVLGWYAKTETTGLDQAAMDTFLTALKDYLKTAGASDEQLGDIVVKSYDGTVAEIGAAINADGDVDILLGVGNNINSTGGVEIIEKAGDVTIGTVARYIARLTGDETVQSVYRWINAAYGTGEPVEPAGAAEPTTPTEPAAPAARSPYLVLGWYAKTETTGLDQAAMDTFLTALKDYLKSAGATDVELSDIVVKAYDGTVAEIGAAINADGDVDILLGVGNNINSTGGVEIIEKDGDVTIGTTGRYIARLTGDETVQNVYSWIKSTYGATT